MNIKLRSLFLCAFLGLLVACSSTPTWEGMSEREIADWKGIGFDAGAAQSWGKKGFNAESANAWNTAGFDLESATRWSSKQFSAEEAGSWRAGGFDLDDSVKNRNKGLTPVAQDPPSAP